MTAVAFNAWHVWLSTLLGVVMVAFNLNKSMPPESCNFNCRHTGCDGSVLALHREMEAEKSSAVIDIPKHIEKHADKGGDKS